MVGALFVSAGFDTLLAKAASFVFAIGLLCPLFLVRDKLTIILTGLYEVLLIGTMHVCKLICPQLAVQLSGSLITHKLYVGTVFFLAL